MPLAVLGRALARDGDREQAAAELERAATTFTERGARRYREAAERDLRQLGVRIHRRSGPGGAGAGGVESLTAREREIAQLIVDRRTNREISEELFLRRRGGTSCSRSRG